MVQFGRAGIDIRIGFIGLAVQFLERFWPGLLFRLDFIGFNYDERPRYRNGQLLCRYNLFAEWAFFRCFGHGAHCGLQHIFVFSASVDPVLCARRSAFIHVVVTCFRRLWHPICMAFHKRPVHFAISNHHRERTRIHGGHVRSTVLPHDGGQPIQ